MVSIYPVFRSGFGAAYSLDIACFPFFILLNGRSYMRNLELLLGRMILNVEILRKALVALENESR